MILKLSKKKDIVKKINNTAQKAISLIIANTAGIKVNDINRLRASCRKIEEINIYITRNSLIIRAIKDTVFEKMQNMVKGQCIIGFSYKSPDITAKIFNNFSKTLDNNFLIKGVLVENRLFKGKDIQLLITLPKYDGALIHFIYILKYISVGRLASILANVYQLLKKTQS